MMNRGAVFSSCGLYRYSLWRVWDPTRPRLLFVMLNPSTADAEKNDPTVERCQRRAVADGFGGVEVVNLFAFKATNPQDMIDSAEAGIDIIGKENDCAIIEAAKRAGRVICAWGTYGSYQDRGRDVAFLMAHYGAPNIEGGKELHALKLTMSGHPAHPLYLPNSLKPFVWEGYAPGHRIGIHGSGVSP